MEISKQLTRELKEFYNWSNANYSYKLNHNKELLQIYINNMKYLKIQEIAKNLDDINDLIFKLKRVL